MVPWTAMKEPLRLPFVLLLVFLCTLAVLTSLQLFAGWGLEDWPVRSFTLELAAARLPRALFEVMLPAVLLSVVLLGFRMVRRPFSRLLGFLIVLGVSYAVLVNGMIWSHRAESGVRQGVGTSAAAQMLPPDSFTAVGARYVAAAAVNGDRLEAVLVIDPARTAPRFTLYASGTVSTKGGVASLQLAGAKPLSLREEMKPAAASLFAADRFTELFLRDFRVMTGNLRELLIRSPGRFLFACFGLLFLVSASLVLLRITRWPLLNVLLLVLAVRAYLLLYHWLAVDLAPTIARIVSDPLLAQLAPSAAFVVLGGFLLLVDILFVPPDRWTAEAGR
jgi:hypothetical protein